MTGLVTGVFVTCHVSQEVILMRLLAYFILTLLAALFVGFTLEGTFRGILPSGRFVLMTAAGGGLALQTVNYRPGRMYLRLAVR